jgi:hypothetical protein
MKIRVDTEERHNDVLVRGDIIIRDTRYGFARRVQKEGLYSHSLFELVWEEIGRQVSDGLKANDT